ncbi:nucleotidyltransferase domain-containing protein [Archaeoglobus sp.]
MIPDIKIIKLEDIEDIINSIRKKLEKTVAEAYIIGSVAEGSAVYGESDLDLLIIPREKTEKLDWHSLLKDELFQLLDRGLNLHILIADNESYIGLIEIARKSGIKVLG